MSLHYYSYCLSSCILVQPLSDNELSMSELLGNISDSTFKQISDRDDVLENVNFGDVFSQLRGVLKSPEKLESYQEVLPGQQTKDQSDVSNTARASFTIYIQNAITCVYVTMKFSILS